jgi:hypothetical protein
MRLNTTIPTDATAAARSAPISRIRAAFAELAPDTIEAIAQRVAELLKHHQAHPANLIDANELARRTGLSRAWIYENAEALGAIRIGTGPKPRLRFDPDALGAAILAGPGKPQPATTPTPPRRRPKPPPTSPDVELLPIRGQQTRGSMSRTILRRRRSHR